MLTQERLKEILNYDPSTGILKWKKRKGVRVSCFGKGFIRIKVDDKIYLSHRLVIQEILSQKQK